MNHPRYQKLAGSIKFGLTQVTACDTENEGWFELKMFVTHVNLNLQSRVQVLQTQNRTRTNK